ncbi:uncharacterized protein LOC131145776 [Malania oleifera]|uniref:uncharacterized protein LOC131145776 n=1 Tax=Malania oleifera TaxID=397392 RepID=UPI0025AE774B|nr:uncharacterized protein LOC131145776 [Malania oleifera]
MRQILQRSESLGRMMKWSIELSEFDIQYQPRPAIKAQVLADFIAERLPESSTKSNVWTLHVDGSSNTAGGGAGFILSALDDSETLFALKLEFTATNNNVEYEALLASLRLAEALGVAQIKAIVTDHRRYFDNERFKKFYLDLSIKLVFASVAHPQSNGQVENMNQMILHELRTRLKSMQGRWAEELPSLIWAYHTTKRAVTGETPFMLVFGAEAVIPAEVGIPSWRRQYFNGHTNKEELRLEIDLLEERQDQASLKVAAYQQRVAKYYNNRVKVRNFQPGDLVLRKTRNNPSESGSHKLKPN